MDVAVRHRLTGLASRQPGAWRGMPWWSTSPRTDTTARATDRG